MKWRRLSAPTSCSIPEQVDVVRQILSDTGQRGVDIAVDCAAKENTVGECIRVVRNTGRVVITGISAETTTPIDLHELRRKEVVIYNVRRSNHETEAAVEMLRARPELFAPIDHTRLAHRQHSACIRDARTQAGWRGKDRPDLLKSCVISSSPHDLAVCGLRN